MFVNVVKPRINLWFGAIWGWFMSVYGTFMVILGWFIFGFTTLTTTNFPVDLIFPQFDSSFIGPCVDIRRVGFLATCFGMGLPSGLMVGEDLCGEDVNLAIRANGRRGPLRWRCESLVASFINRTHTHIYIYICENTHTYNIYICINK